MTETGQPAVKPGAGNTIWGTGRRKTAVARVRLVPGTGRFEINGRPCDTYFTEVRDRAAAQLPLKLTNLVGQYDVLVNAEGGGLTGQAGAVKMGLARAILQVQSGVKKTLYEAGCLTRDSRMKERKKYGQRGARRRFQFSKR